MDAGLRSLPAQAPLAMPVQDLASREASRHTPVNPPQVFWSRLCVFTASLALTALGTYEVYQVISPVGVTALQVVFAVLFALTFAWIAFACVSACLGFTLLLFGRNALPPLAPLDRCGRTALLMPVYNEKPDKVFATLAAMGRDLRLEGASQWFDIFVLSDTRDPAIAASEEEAFTRLKRRLGPYMGVYYRRRHNNHQRKAGNIADFVRRWGGAYPHMVVLDADSWMDATTLITLTRAMAADKEAGIIQSLPLLHRRWTPFARMIQFSGRVYGPLVAAGLAAWHGKDGNYWGHNAIIRTRAFAEAAGLPELSGRKPFGGHVLSHDFVEAALMRRAGWSVTMLPMLPGSYEETPTSLADLAARDRRWAQGNLQHLKIVGAKGLHWASRLHLIQGIMSYLASPLWLLLLVAGLTLATIARYATPDYFPEPFLLFPAWPVFDPERALRLFGLTLVVLYLPRMLGLLLALANRELRQGCGGARGLLSSFGAETVLSALLSPVMMLIQSRFVADIFLGRDSGWNAQNRDEAATPFGEHPRRHAIHVATGLAFGALALVISPMTFFWFLPIVLGLVLAPAIAWAGGLPELGVRLWRWNVFRIPEERQGPALEPRDVALEPQLQAAE
jgi:membrane glycosyltransferase